MSETSKNVNYTPAVILGLAMALGPLTALSIGSRVADEDTLKRAQAGAANAKPGELLSAEMLAPYAAKGVPAYASGKTVADILASSGMFGSFEQALQMAGVDRELAASGEYTVFAPTDEAFSKMSESERNALLSDKAALAALLKKHIVLGRHNPTDLIRSETVQALDGSELHIGPSARFNGHVGVANAQVVKSGLYASNGVVHVIDRVIQ
jgi:uncharacterized surface protein with fasciclin (FAS1) repeats